jgi:hypothetical protein
LRTDSRTALERYYSHYSDSWMNSFSLNTDFAVSRDGSGTADIYQPEDLSAPISTQFVSARSQFMVAPIQFAWEASAAGVLSANLDARRITGTFVGRTQSMRGRGRAMVTSREIVERMAQAVRAGSPLPDEGGLRDGLNMILSSTDAAMRTEAARYMNGMIDASRGSTNLAIIGYLLFPPLPRDR